MQAFHPPSHVHQQPAFHCPIDVVVLKVFVQIAVTHVFQDYAAMLGLVYDAKYFDDIRMVYCTLYRSFVYQEIPIVTVVEKMR